MKRLLGGKRRFYPGAVLVAATAAVISSGTANAGMSDYLGYNDGKVLATGGVSMTDGAGGGGITPWATITGYETRDGINGDLHFTWVSLPNYSLNSLGAAIGLYDRVELSYTGDVLPTGSTFDTVGLAASALGGLGVGVKPFNTTIKMDVYGAKVRLFGEAIYDSDNLIPQVAFGGFYKVNHNKDLLDTLQAAKSKDYELYLSATKIFFPINTLINLTARYTAANETGLTGFGGPDGSKKEIRPEVSIAYLLKKDTAIGFEYQKHGDNLNGKSVKLGGLDATGITGLLGTLPGVADLGASLTQKKESDWQDVFVAYFPSKNLSITMAYAMLGNITLTPDQSGYYVSLQASF